MNLYLFYAIGPWQVIIIVAVILLLFGGRKIPELMGGLGKGIKEFENDPVWHARQLKGSEIDVGKKRLGIK